MKISDYQHQREHFLWLCAYAAVTAGTENPNKITGLWLITAADCSNMSDDYSGHAKRGRVDWKPNDEIRLSLSLHNYHAQL